MIASCRSRQHFWCGLPVSNGYAVGIDGKNEVAPKSCKRRQVLRFALLKIDKHEIARRSGLGRSLKHCSPASTCGRTYLSCFAVDVELEDLVRLIAFTIRLL